LASFVASGFVFWQIQLRKIMAFCALLQRMGIFGGEREKSLNFRSNVEFVSNFRLNSNSRNRSGVMIDINNYNSGTKMLV